MPKGRGFTPRFDKSSFTQIGFPSVEHSALDVYPHSGQNVFLQSVFLNKSHTYRGPLHPSHNAAPDGANHLAHLVSFTVQFIGLIARYHWVSPKFS